MGRAVALVGVAARLHQGHLKRRFGQCCHRVGDGVQRRGMLKILHSQTLDDQLARHTQSARQRAALLHQGLDQRGDGAGVEHALAWRRQQSQLVGVTAAHALHKT